MSYFNCFAEMLENNQGLIAFISVIIGALSFAWTVKISRTTEHISSGFVDKKKIDEYLHQYNFDFSLHNDQGENITAHTLADLEHYSKLGYYGHTTPEIWEHSYGEALLEFIKLLRNAKTDYNPTGDKFIDILKSLPASTLIVEPIEDSESLSNIPISRYIKTRKVSIEIDGASCRFQFSDNEAFCVFDQLYRADFSGRKREEVLFTRYYKSAGTLKFSILLGAYFGREHWYNIRKNWHLLDLDKINIDEYADPFGGIPKK